MDAEARTTGEIGEAGLLEEIARRAPKPPPGEVWVGDDTAVIPSPGPRLLFTTDLLVEDVDFDLGWASGADVGFKAMAVNLSDIAAMGGTPNYAVATMSLRPDLPVTFARELLEGLESAAETWEVVVVGGDISSAEEITVGVAMIGSVGERAVLRSGAQPDDAICVTGTLGAAAGGLLALRSGSQEKGDLDGLIERQLRPAARLREGALLAGAGATAMIDVSDGLGLDLSRLMDASGLGCAIDPSAIPVDPGLEALRAALGADVDPARLALSGGEDFELLFTCPSDVVGSISSALDELGTPCTQIGRATQERGIFLGSERVEGGDLGWDHLRSR